MAEQYLGSRANTNDFKIQELIRVIDATLGELNSHGLVTGQNCLSIIKFISSFEGFKDFVSPGFVTYIEDEVQKTEGKVNVREQVKKILTYPRTDYPPWIDMKVSKKIMREIQEKVEEMKFKLGLVEGKVYGKCDSEISLNQVVYEKLKDCIPSLKLNFETCHITVVNSNVVADIGKERVEEFLEKFDEEFTVITGKIKSTFSEDWSRFGECYVIEVRCPYVDKFLEEFNEQFGKELKIAKHITFAIQPRSLMNSL